MGFCLELEAPKDRSHAHFNAIREMAVVVLHFSSIGDLAEDIFACIFANKTEIESSVVLVL